MCRRVGQKINENNVRQLTVENLETLSQLDNQVDDSDDDISDDSDDDDEPVVKKKVIKK